MEEEQLAYKRKNNKVKAWISAFRFRTLPLAAGGIVLGSFLPESLENFSWTVFILALLTAIGLQILSNLKKEQTMKSG
jgi:1,4-dihydroxy-2-naphthoate octaprenyltransferase